MSEIAGFEESEKFKDQQPIIVRQLVTAGVSLLAAVGVTVTAGVQEAAVPVILGALAVFQAWRGSKKVVSLRGIDWDELGKLEGADVLPDWEEVDDTSVA